MHSKSIHPHSVTLGIWLLICAAVVYLMIVVGGITRLTQSGLSMVEWAPIMGILPPMGEAAWLDVFTKYQASPEYQKINFGMSLDSFKGIFWWEYGHRVLGRVIGMIYLLPLIYFMLRGMVPASWRLRLLGLFVLGGMQGLMGWYMVKSGLVDVPQVSQYRLTAHLGLAVLIFTYMLWFAFDFLRGESRHNKASRGYLRISLLAVVLIFIMMLSGGFVAGTDAGFIMNTFPKMNGEWIPQAWMAIEPWWRNLFENPVTVQFLHRCIALLVVAVVLVLFRYSLRQRFSTKASWVLLLMLIQVTLGISALLMAVPVALGAAHQAGAVALLASAILVAHIARKTSAHRVRNII